MSEAYRFTRGTIPLLVSSPHSGTEVPPHILARFSREARTLPDTDWHIPQLYEFTAELGASQIEAVFSRYIIDLNRPPDNESLYPGKPATGLCPVEMFDGAPLYIEGREPGSEEIDRRRTEIWQPYHDRIAEELQRLKAEHGYALLYDCHSIRSLIPRLFAGRLPTLNLGTYHGESCAAEIAKEIEAMIGASEYSGVVNGRFVGGHITRSHGNPAENIHAVQMELTKADYMNEDYPYAYESALAGQLQPTLRSVIEAFVAAGASLHSA